MEFSQDLARSERRAVAEIVAFRSGLARQIPATVPLPAHAISR
jgi:hypothetical protein